MSRQCRSKVELIQLGSAHEKYGVCTRPKSIDTRFKWPFLGQGRAWVSWRLDATSELRNKNGFLLRSVHCRQHSKDLEDRIPSQHQERNQKRTED